MSWWCFTVVWVTASLLRSLGLFQYSGRSQQCCILCGLFPSSDSLLFHPLSNPLGCVLSAPNTIVIIYLFTSFSLMVYLFIFFFFWRLTFCFLCLQVNSLVTSKLLRSRKVKLEHGDQGNGKWYKFEMTKVIKKSLNAMENNIELRASAVDQNGINQLVLPPTFNEERGYVSISIYVWHIPDAIFLLRHKS